MNVTEDDPPVRLFAVPRVCHRRGCRIAGNAELHSSGTEVGTNQAGGDDGVNGFTNGGTERTEAKRRRGDVAGPSLSAPRAARPSEYVAHGGKHARLEGQRVRLRGRRTHSSARRRRARGQRNSPEPSEPLRFAFVDPVSPFVNSRSPTSFTFVFPPPHLSHSRNEAWRSAEILGDDSFVSMVIGYYPERRWVRCEASSARPTA